MASVAGLVSALGSTRAAGASLRIGADNPARAGQRALHVVLDNFRAVLALIATLLVLEVRSGNETALEVAAGGFAGYATLILLLSANGKRVPSRTVIAWFDALWCMLLFGLAGGANGFFLLLFFPVLFAAVAASLRQSVLIAAVCAGVAATVLASQPGEAAWLRIVIVPAALLLLGPTTALLAYAESQTQQGYAVASELIDALDAQRGVEEIVDRALAIFVRRVDCDAAALAVRARDGRLRVFTYGRDRGIAEMPAAAVALVAADLLALPHEQSISRRNLHARPWRLPYTAFDPRVGVSVRAQETHPAFAGAAQLVECANVVLVPAGRHGATAVWLLLGRDQHAFGPHVQSALHRPAEQVAAVLDNALLLEQLVAATADAERARIGRDLHDSAIQPYVGLKFAIEALARRVPADSPLERDAQALVAMANAELRSLREIVSGLRGARGDGEALLERAVRRQAARFAVLFGMRVDVTTEGALPVSRRLSGELFHMVSEGLSNVRRHTRARRAAVSLTGGNELTLTIFNEATPDEPAPAPFEPRSLTERATELGGTATVRIDAAGTTVRVCLPWPQEDMG